MSSEHDRAPRPGGRRSSPVAWRRVARSTTAAAAVAPAVVAALTGRVDQALRAFQVLNSSAAVATRRAVRQELPQADTVDELSAIDDTVLFLREFADDNAPFSQSDARHDRGPVAGRLAFLWQDPDEEFLSFERYVGPELTRRVGPVVGLGNPPSTPARAACSASAPEAAAACWSPERPGRGRTWTRSSRDWT